MFSTRISNDSTILKLRVKGSDLDPLALRGRLQNLLGEVSLQPRLPPSATLFIRKLNDPLPGLLQLDTSYPRAPEAWRHAFNTQFEQLVSSAARPAFGPVGDSVESVVFYDYSELLASLTADWCSGYATTRWWWQSLIQRGDVAQMIKRLWRDKVEYVPAALEQLVKRNVLVEFVSRLSDDEVRVLVQRVVHVFALHELHRRVIREPQIERMTEPDLPPKAGRLEATLTVPWRHVVTEGDTPRLRPVQQLFVGIGLMIRRAPSRVRTVRFAKEFEEWYEQVIELSRVREPVVTSFEQAVFDEPAQTSEIVVVDEIVKSATTTVDTAPLDAPPAPVLVERKRERIKIGNAVFSYEEPVAIPQAFTEEPPIAAIYEADRQIDPAPEVLTQVSEYIETITIETELGGIFYLVNLGIFLDIYDDLNIWDFVTIVGTELLDDPNFDDPIWTTLLELQDSDPFHPKNPVKKPTWLTELMPSLRARLHLALGTDTEADLAGLLLHQSAKVTITTTHIDVFFSLAEHPIELRLSGLDRNPGWVPAAGRFIAFHYD